MNGTACETFCDVGDAGGAYELSLCLLLGAAAMRPRVRRIHPHVRLVS
jgi:hypothetical protein